MEPAGTGLGCRMGQPRQQTTLARAAVPDQARGVAGVRVRTALSVEGPAGARLLEIFGRDGREYLKSTNIDFWNVET